MTVMTHEPSTGTPIRQDIASRLLVPGFWASVSIVTIWLAVLFDGIFGGDMTFPVLVAVPIAAIAAGWEADHLALRQAHAQQAAEHEVTAVLLQRAQAAGVPDPYTSVQMTYALARWQPPGQSPRSGQVLVPAGAPAGSTVAVWIDASGAVASPPPGHREIAGNVYIAAIVTSLVTILLLLESNALARRVLDRRRLSAWDADWRAIGPLWSGHRS